MEELDEEDDDEEVLELMLVEELIAVELGVELVDELLLLLLLLEGDELELCANHLARYISNDRQIHTAGGGKFTGGVEDDGVTGGLVEVGPAVKSC